MITAEYGICEVLRDDRTIGLGFVLDGTHVVTCAHVVNTAVGRIDRRDPQRPDTAAPIVVQFPIGNPAGGDTRRTASVVGWLPGGPGSFDARDIAVLELADPIPAHVSVLHPARYRSSMAVQMWGPQPDRPADGGHVLATVLGESRSGRVQIIVRGGRFRVRPGFSGGPVWEIATGNVIGILSACGVEEDAVDAYLLTADWIAAAWPAWHLPQDRASRPEPDLLDRVIDAARHHPDFTDAQLSRADAGAREHLLARIEVRVGGRVLGAVVQPIGAVTGDVTEERIAQFAATVRAYRHDGSAGVPGTLVYTGRPASAALLALAAQSSIDLRSFAEFQTGIDLRPFADRQHAEVTGDARYPQRGYVAQRFTAPPDPAVADETLIDSLLRWLAEPDGHLVVVLAPFGHGKTYLLYELARRMHDRPDYPAIPVLVRLRDLERNHDIDELVAAQLTRGGERRVDLDRLSYLRREGRIVLLFDGFDELARRVTYDQAGVYLATIVQAAEGRAKVVLTSRRESFLTDRDVQAAFGRQLATVAGRQIVEITDFDADQIRQYVATRLDESDSDRFLTVLDSTGLRDLAANPRMLSLLTQIGGSALQRAAPDGRPLTAAWVFEQIVTEWLTVEYKRLNPYGADAGAWVGALRAAATGLAVALWTSGAAALRVADLDAYADTLLAVPGGEHLDHDEAVHVLGSGSLLVRVGDGRFDFVHRSLMEWLVVTELDRRLAGGAAALTVWPLTPLQINLLGEIAQRDRIAAWIQESIKDPDDRIRSNALAAAQRLRVTLAEPPNLRGQDLRGQDLTGQDLAGADLAGADLTDAVLDGADLRRADLTGAVLIRTRLDRALLSGAILNGADLRDARLLGADLRSVRWTGVASTLRAVTLGAQTDGDAVAALAAGGGIPPDHPAILQRSTTGGFGRPVAASFDPSGEYLAVACGICVQVWQFSIGAMVQALLAGGRVSSVAWSPDGRSIAAGVHDGGVKIWDAITADRRSILTADYDARTIEWSPDSKHLAVGSGHGDEPVEIWDTLSGVLHLSLGTQSSSRSLAWSPDGHLIATACGHDALRIWDTRIGTLVRTLRDLAYWDEVATWSPDGRYIAVGYRTVEIVDADSGDLVQTLTLDSGGDYIRAMAWSPDSRQLAFGGWLFGTHIWTVGDGPQVRALDNNATINLLAWTPDGRYLLNDDVGGYASRIEVIDTETAAEVRKLTGDTPTVAAVAWSSDGRDILALSSAEGYGPSYRGKYRVWNTATRSQASSHVVGLGMASHYHHPIAWSPDRRQLAVGTNPSTVVISDANTDSVTHTLMGVQLTSTVGVEGAVAWSPDGRQVAFGSNVGAVFIWSVDDERLLHTLRDVGSSATLAWSPDGRLLAGGREQLRIWSPRTGSVMHTLADAGLVASVAWAPDSRRLAVGGDSGVQVREMSAATPVLLTVDPPDTDVYAVAWSPDSHWIAATCDDNVTRVWNADTGALAHSLDATSAAPSVAWSPDSRHLATGHEDNTVSLWDAVNGSCLATFVPLADGWATVHDDQHYDYDGTVRGEFWWTIGLTRVEIADLERHLGEK